MARTPSISGYRTTRKPKLTTQNNPLGNYATSEQNLSSNSNLQDDALKGYVANETNNAKSVDPSVSNTTPSTMGTNMSRDITNYAKSPVNSDLDYYTKLTNLRNNNNMLVEKYGLQSIRDNAESELMQQDVLKQQQQRALEEQMRATGINNSGMADTLRSNILSNYNTNINAIQNQYQSDINSAVDQQRLDLYGEMKNNLQNYITSLDTYGESMPLEQYNKFKEMINTSDLANNQKNDLMKYLDTYSNVETPNDMYVEGINVNDNGDLDYTPLGITIPQQLKDLAMDSETLSTLITTLQLANPSIDNFQANSIEKYNSFKKAFVNGVVEKLGLDAATATLYRDSLEQLYDNAFNDVKTTKTEADFKQETKAALEEEQNKKNAGFNEYDFGNDFGTKESAFGNEITIKINGVNVNFTTSNYNKVDSKKLDDAKAINDFLKAKDGVLYAKNGSSWYSLGTSEQIKNRYNIFKNKLSK